MPTEARTLRQFSFVWNIPTLAGPRTAWFTPHRALSVTCCSNCPAMMPPGETHFYAPICGYRLCLTCVGTLEPA